jgi:hypothetical protein
MSDQNDVARALAELMQTHVFEVEAALSAHLDWKRQLRDAIARGYCEIDSDMAGQDDLCALGRWLYSLPPECSADPWFAEVLELHARFHQNAAVVVQCIEAGRLEEARAAMDPDTDFARTSEELVGLMEQWRDAA